MKPRPKDRPSSVTDFLILLNIHDSSSEDLSGFSHIRSTTNEETVLASSLQVVEGIEVVDLGLSVKWAKCNLGASLPEDCGYYFAWGEVKPKENYTNSSYNYLSKTRLWGKNKYIKYNTQKENGWVDRITQLEESDDAAHAYWGMTWRVPTIEEFKELIEKCHIERTVLNGIHGVKVSRNGKVLFFPALGYKIGQRVLDNTKIIYSSSSLCVQNPNYFEAFYCTDRAPGTCFFYRYYGFPIRAVLG